MDHLWKTKNECIFKSKRDSRYIYYNEYKDSAGRSLSYEVLCYKAFNNANNEQYDRY